MRYGFITKLSTWDASARELLANELETLTATETSKENFDDYFHPIEQHEGDFTEILHIVETWVSQVLLTENQYLSNPIIQDKIPEAKFIFDVCSTTWTIELYGVLEYNITNDCIAEFGEGVQCKIKKLGDGKYQCYITSTKRWEYEKNRILFSLTASINEIRTKASKGIFVNVNKVELEDNTENSEEMIQALHGIEPIRLRPIMYIGNTNESGYHILFIDTMGYFIRRMANNLCSTVNVILRDERTIVIEANGQGIPMQIYPYGQRPILEVYLTSLFAGGSPDSFTLANALSESLVVDTYVDGIHHRAIFVKGEMLSPIQQLGVTDKQGITIMFTPDREIFGEVLSFSPDILCDYLRHSAYLVPMAQLSFHNDMTGFTDSYHCPEGSVRFVRDMNEDQKVMHPIVHFTDNVGEIKIDLSFQYHMGETQTVVGYVNGRETSIDSLEKVSFYMGLGAGIAHCALEKYKLLFAYVDNDIESILETTPDFDYRHYWNYYAFESHTQLSEGGVEHEDARLLRMYCSGITAVISIWITESAISFHGFRSSAASILISTLTCKAISQCCTDYPQVMECMVGRFHQYKDGKSS